MSLNSLESEGLRPLHSLLLVQRLLRGKCLCGQSLSPSPSLSMTLFGSILALFFIQKPRCLPVWGDNRNFRVALSPVWIQGAPSRRWFSPVAELLTSEEDWTSYCSGSWMAVGRVNCQRRMLCYGSKTPLESSPSPLPSQEDLLWLFSSHICCKIMRSSWFESLIQFGCGQMLANRVLCIFWEGL